MNDNQKINKDIRDNAVMVLMDQTTDLGLPFTVEDDKFIVALPPLDDPTEEPLLD